MYFSSLKDDELDYFHKTINASFTMSLTDILSSDLFKVDEVVEDVLYRIYPLFYCTNAISSNPKDKMMDNKCFICTVGEHETYMSFTKGEGDNLIIDESSMTLYDIGDSLSADEFNAMVYRLRSKEVLTGTLNFEESTTLTGLYGTYELLHTENQPRNDYGYIINDTVKDNPLTVKLTNPFFDSANYKLTFTVKSITGANIFDETSEQYVDTDELTITLTEDEEVAIDLTEYTNDSVLLYDVSVEVDFKTAEKTNADYNLTLTSNHDSIHLGSSLTLTATLTSTEAGVTGYTVQFYDGNTLLDTEVTDANGEASITITPSTVTTHIYKAQVIGLTSTVNVIVNKTDTTLTLTTDYDTYNKGETINYSGTLLDEYGQPIANQQITTTITYPSTTRIYTKTTDENGAFNGSTPADAYATYTLVASFDNTNTHAGSTSTKVITVEKYNITITSNPVLSTPVMYGSIDTREITVKTNPLHGTPTVIAGAKLDVIDTYTTYSEDATTDNNGKATIQVNRTRAGYVNSNQWNIRVNVKSGNTYKAGSIWEDYPITKASTVITMTMTTHKASGYLKNTDGYGLSNRDILLYVKFTNGYQVTIGVTTNSNGYFEQTITGNSFNTNSYKAVFNGDDNCETYTLDHNW